MVSSINTNRGAMIGLQNLSSTRDRLNNIQNQIATGKKINSPKDDAATLAIATQLLADYSGTAAVRDGLDRAEATVDVALTAGQDIADALIDMKRLAVQAQQEGLDQAARDALNNEFNELRKQIETSTDSAEFSGTNLINAGASDQQVLSSEAGDRMTVAAQDLSTSGLGIDTLSLDTAANAATALDALDAAINDASLKLANLGSSGKALENHNTVLGRQNDTLKAGIGNLVDADLGEASAALAANQIKEKLGVLALNIANGAPRNVLALFNS
jgi:flagellin